MQTIKVYGFEQPLPCYQTMGAWVFFKEVSGKEVTAIALDAPSEVADFLYATVRAACLREGIAFDMNRDEFACRVSLDDLTDWANSLQAELGSESKKKAPRSKH